MESGESDVVQLDYTFEADSGGISSIGKYYWMVSENELQLFRLPLGTRTANWVFLDSNSDPVCYCGCMHTCFLITCVDSDLCGQRSFYSSQTQIACSFA